MSLSADRMLDLLEYVLSASQPPATMEASAALRIDKSTVSRMLGQLVDRGLITRNAAHRFEPGAGSYALAVLVARKIDVRAAAAQFLIPLRDMSNETMSVHSRVDSLRVCVDGVESREPLRRIAPVGEAVELWIGPSSRAILAFVDPPLFELFVARAVNAGVDEQALRDDLADIVEVGYCHRLGGRTAGIRAVSVPLFGADAVAGSITMTGPGDRYTEERALQFLEPLLHAARAITESIGGRPR